MDSIKVIMAALCCIIPFAVTMSWVIYLGGRMCIMPEEIKPPTEKPKVSPPPPPPGPKA